MTDWDNWVRMVRENDPSTKCDDCGARLVGPPNYDCPRCTFGWF